MATGASKSANTPSAAAAASPPGYADYDQLGSTLSTALAALAAMDPAVQAGEIADNITALLNSQMPAPNQPFSDQDCNLPATDVAQPTLQQTLDKAKAQTQFTSAGAAAASTWHTEVGNWQQAQSQYSFAMGSAWVTLQTAVTAATGAYIAKSNPDSKSRDNNLFYTMQEAIATAVEAYLVSAQSAATALTGEGANLLAAYSGYFAQASQAQANLLIAQATADQAFWQGVEQTRDSL